MRIRPWILLACGVAAAAPAGAGLPELLYVSEGNRLRRYDIDTLDRGPLLEEIVFQNADTDPRDGRNINGMVCALPDGSGLLVAGEDTDQPYPPAGWGVLTGYGAQVGKLTATALVELPEPFGCAFDARGRLFTTEVGRQFFGGANGQLIAWLPPFVGFPGPPGAYPDTAATSDGYCKLATDIGTATGVTVDRQGRVYVAAASGMEVLRFSPPFPTGTDAAHGCGARDELGSPMAEPVRRERFVGPLWRRGMLTYSGLALAPNGNLYAASVATGRIAEFDLDGRLVRMVLEPDDWLPPYETGYPQGLAVDSRGTLYYADLDLTLAGLSVDTGPDGKVWRIRFDAAGNPGPPEIVARGLRFPDGLGVLPGDLEAGAELGLRNTPPATPAPESPESGEGVAGALLLLVVLVVTGGALLLARRRRESLI
jgi:hypothetical protein